MHSYSRLLLILIFLPFFPLFGWSQGNAPQRENLEEVEILERKPLQLSFFHPLSTNGPDGEKMENHFSLNLIYGYAGGLNGFELGGVNGKRLRMKGAQIAYAANINQGTGAGVQLAGLTNIGNGTFLGMQGAGVANVAADHLTGAQLAGITNITRQNFGGWQLASAANLVGGEVHGAQMAGAFNLSNQKLTGLQTAGLLNVAGKGVLGMQGAGFLNISGDRVTGLQMGGFTNVSGGGVSGAQIAGFANLGGRDVIGAQIAGFFNSADYVKGMQLGLVNHCDSIDGVPIGLVSVVNQNGYRKIDAWGGEALHMNLAYRMGVKSFHNLFGIGTNFGPGGFRWATGYGFGTEFDLGDVAYMNVDLMAWQVHEQEFITKELNLLNQAKVTIGGYSLGGFSIYAGPTFNLLVSDYYGADGAPAQTFAPWTVYDKMHGGTRVQMWPGVQVGVRY